jgi:outer membrane murein-binding lipoprotein Lpp
MKSANLTTPARHAHSPRMGPRRTIAAVIAVLGSTLVSGCISVNAPDKPIVIELNINITQEVIYRLAEDVRQNIDANPEIF